MCLYLIKLGFSHLIFHSAVQYVIAVSLHGCDAVARKLRTVVNLLSEEGISSKERCAQLHCITPLIVVGGIFGKLTHLDK